MKHEKYFIETSAQNRLCIKTYQPDPTTITSPFPIVLVHGLLNSSDLFDVPNLQDLSLVNSLVERGFSVYTYDQRGCGESSTADWNFGLKENALVDLPAVISFCLNHSGREKVILGGYSLGGIILYCFYTYLIRAEIDHENITPGHISKIFTLASPGVFHQRKGRWKRLFRRGDKMLQKAGPFIDRTQFIHGQIYIYSLLLSKLISISSIKLCLRIAQAGLLGAALIKALPVPSFLYSHSDFDAKTFLKVIRSKVLDRTSTKIFQELFHFAAQNGSITLETDDTTISLPEDFRYWDNIPILLISSNRDQLVKSSEVEVVHQQVKSSIHLNIDSELGQGCGHAGYVFKRGLTDLVRERIYQFLIEG